jgi:phosphopantothenoylcysteine decarboxylase/phosphopantothenate--cysteine ligase
MLENKKIVLGITGGNAAYKAAELTRALVKAGAQVRVHHDEKRRRVHHAADVADVSQARCTWTCLRRRSAMTWPISRWPTGPTFCGRAGDGKRHRQNRLRIADDLLTTTLMAQNKPALVCPAMNDKMLANPAVQENIGKLVRFGYTVLDSGVGELACKTTGAGRLPDIPDILDAIEGLFSPRDFAGEKVLITAGPTQEPLDPVRYITNQSSGKMGYALARAAHQRGAHVTLVSGPTPLSAPRVERFIRVRTAREMHQAVLDCCDDATIIIKAAAVADYRPKTQAAQKIKKDRGLAAVELVRNPDILADLGARKKKGLLVGFAMETEDLLANARRKLVKKNIDMIVANNLREEGAGFQGDTNIITILDKNGQTISLEKMSKTEAAHRILDHVRTLGAQKGSRGKK